jgi:hypothetical protein
MGRELAEKCPTYHELGTPKAIGLRLVSTPRTMSAPVSGPTFARNADYPYMMWIHPKATVIPLTFSAGVNLFPCKTAALRAESFPACGRKLFIELWRGAGWQAGLR